MANYIQTLQNMVEEKDFEISELKATIQELVVYLSSEKFSVETHVSKYDILSMLGRY